jgi:hypothetical protein
MDNLIKGLHPTESEKAIVICEMMSATHDVVTVLGGKPSGYGSVKDFFYEIGNYVIVMAYPFEFYGWDNMFSDDFQSKFVSILKNYSERDDVKWICYACCKDADDYQDRVRLYKSEMGFMPNKTELFVYYGVTWPDEFEQFTISDEKVM